MSKKNLQSRVISNRTRIVLLVGDFLLLGVLALNIFQLFRIKANIAAILSNSILAARPEEFISQVTASGVSWLTWVINVGSLIITAGFIVMLLAPKLQIKRLVLANIIWLGAWLLYIIVSLVIVVVVAMSFLSFT